MADTQAHINKTNSVTNLGPIELSSNSCTIIVNSGSNILELWLSNDSVAGQDMYIKFQSASIDVIRNGMLLCSGETRKVIDAIGGIAWQGEICAIAKTDSPKIIGIAII